MVSRLKASWREFRSGRPGRRFQDRHERNRRRRRSKPAHLRMLHTALGMVLILIGVVLVFIPGPAVVFFAIGGGMLSDDFRIVARMLDWTEVKVRRIYDWARRWWKRSSLATRGGFIGLGTVGAAMVVYFAYQVLMPN